MNAFPADHPHLRLVGGSIGVSTAESFIAAENRRAAANPDIKPTDPRWVLAVRAYSQLQGSTLTPQRRQKVLRTAEQLGVRPFDANVIIAIVQDHARTGRSLSDAAPTLSLLHEAAPAQTSPHTIRWLAAIVAAAAINFLLILWILSG